MFVVFRATVGIEQMSVCVIKHLSLLFTFESINSLFVEALTCRALAAFDEESSKSASACHYWFEVEIDVLRGV